MRGVTLPGNSTVELVELPDPKPGTGQVLLDPVPVRRERTHPCLENDGRSTGVSSADLQVHPMAVNVDQ